MNISYFVDVGEEFKPPVDRQAPSNFNPEKFCVEYRSAVDDKWRPIADGGPLWLARVRYRLSLKPARVSSFRGIYLDGGMTGPYSSPAILANPRYAFIVETVIENGTVIDAKVTKQGEK